MADQLTPFQQALRSLPLDLYEETLALIDKLTRNVVRNPSEEKFRKINLTNERIKKAITDVPNAVQLLAEMGWVREGDSLVLPPKITLAHEVHVVGIIDVIDWYKTEVRKHKLSEERAAKSLNADEELLRRQIELDRKEKAAEGPITKGSVAKTLPKGGQMTAGDIGIGKNSGG